MNLDLSKFKKIESDEKCTILAHPSGHKIKIAHKGISSEVKKQIEDLPMNLAKGGMAKYAQKFDPNMKGSKASKVSDSSNRMPGSPTEAKDAFTEPDALGTSIPKGMLQEELRDKQFPDVVVNALDKKAPPFGPLGSEAKQHYPPCINPSCKSFGSSHPHCTCYGGKFHAEGGEVVDDEYFCDSNRPHFKNCQYFRMGGMTEEPVDPNPEVAQTKNPMPQPPIAADVSDNSAPEPSPVPSPNAEINPNPETPASSSQPEEATAPVGGSAPEAAPPQEAQKEMAPAEHVLQHKERIAQDIVPEVQAFKADLDNGHIQPQTYHDLFAKKDTLGKIGTLFGLLLSGAGSGLAHQSNAIMDMMNKELERDFQAQQKSSENKQNFLKINQSARLNSAQTHLTEAEAGLKDQAKSRMQMNWAALHNLVTLNNKLDPNSPQYQQGQQVLAMLHQGVQNENFNIADRAATAGALASYLGGGQGGGQNTMMMKSGLLGPEAREMGGDLEQKTIPGIPGKANRPIQEQDRKQIQAMNVLSDKAADLLNFAKEHKGTLSPSQRAKGAQKAEEMINFYNSSIEGGILTQGRLEWLDKQIKKNPTSVFQDILGNNARLAEIKNSNDHRRNMLLSNYGFQVPKGSGQQPSSNNTTSKSGRPMIQKDGKWYYQ